MKPHGPDYHDDLIGLTGHQVIVADNLVLWALGSRDGHHPDEVIGNCVECWSSVAVHLANWLVSALLPTGSFNDPKRLQVIEAIKADIAEIGAPEPQGCSH